MIFYMPFESPFLIENIKRAFSGTNFGKIYFSIGDRAKSFQTYPADSYILENSYLVDRYFATPHASRVEILLPMYEHNMMDGRTESEKLTEQVEYQRLNIREDAHAYMEKYNVSINATAVPI
jgi:hypothetical protein